MGRRVVELARGWERWMAGWQWRGPVAIAWIDARDGRSDRLVSQLGQSLSSRESEEESEGDGERSLDTLLGMRLVR